MKLAASSETVSSTELYDKHKTYAEQVALQQEITKGHNQDQFKIMSEMMGIIMPSVVAFSRSEAAANPAKLDGLRADLSQNKQEISFNNSLNEIAEANYNQNIATAQDNIDVIMSEAVAENAARNSL